MRFEVKETNENAIAYIVASPLVKNKTDIYVNQYYGPQSLKDYDAVYGNDTVTAYIDNSEKENGCSISQEDAKQLVEQFLKETGRDNQVLYGQQDYSWDGANEIEVDGEQYTDYAEVIDWGYLFGYGTVSMDWHLVILWIITTLIFLGYAENSDVNFELEDEIRFAVTDNGITEVFMQYP